MGSSTLYSAHLFFIAHILKTRVRSTKYLTIAAVSHHQYTCATKMSAVNPNPPKTKQTKQKKTQPERWQITLPVHDESMWDNHLVQIVLIMSGNTEKVQVVAFLIISYLEP